MAVDRTAPAMASHHQKMVCIDDRVAFVGGMDPPMRAGHPRARARRLTTGRQPGLIPRYGFPYHDIMLAVDGEAARFVGEACRERFRRTTSGSLDARESPEAPTVDSDPWPPELTPLLRDRPVAFAFTHPGTESESATRQVEATLLEQIRSAERSIFIETQYFTVASICDALCERLREPGGPEIVLILPYGCPGTLQSMALDPRRDELLARLRVADPGDRLGIYWPTLSGGDEEDVHRNAVYVHAKTLVVDDRLLRIGSANLANRSMGLDSECDVFTWSEADDGEAREAISDYRRRLLGYLLGVRGDEVAQAERRVGSLVGAVDSLREGRQTLTPFEHTASPLAGIGFPVELADPDGPLSPDDAMRVAETLLAARAPSERLRAGWNATIGWVRSHKAPLAAAVAVLLVAVVLGTGVSPLPTDAQTLGAALERIRESPLGLVGVGLGFGVGATVGVPVTLSIAALAAAFEPRTAILVSVAGVALSATLGFFLGGAVRRLDAFSGTAEHLSRISRRVDRRGVLALALLRNVPLAPYAVVNAACGFATLRFPSYLAGTLIGMLPGIVLAGVFGQELGMWLRDPTPAGLARMGAVLAVVVVSAWGLDRALARYASDASPGEATPGDDPGEGPQAR